MRLAIVWTRAPIAAAHVAETLGVGPRAAAFAARRTAASRVRARRRSARARRGGEPSARSSKRPALASLREIACGMVSCAHSVSVDGSSRHRTVVQGNVVVDDVDVVLVDVVLVDVVLVDVVLVDVVLVDVVLVDVVLVDVVLIDVVLVLVVATQIPAWHVPPAQAASSWRGRQSVVQQEPAEPFATAPSSQPSPGCTVPSPHHPPSKATMTGELSEYCVAAAATMRPLGCRKTSMPEKGTLILEKGDE
ncbi:MAG TPA: hypothetical protein VGR62_14855 [Candidatus Binatia bacterium]|nr:hypothetical protein [Candidatus Binatia bacterium]